MTSHKKYVAALAALGALAIPTVAIASSTEQTPNLIPPGAPSGYLAINKTTCKFIHPEIDVHPTAHERYARAEDSRDDVKLNCLTNRKQPRARLLYTRVLAVGTGHTVTVGCPPGYLVVSGGSQSETTGSYPATDDTWTVVRDHLSPRILDARAVCVELVQR
jgi:hypothetical protein